MKRITTKAGQTLFDIALQEYGSAEGVFLLMKDNPSVIKGVQCSVEPGTILRIVSSPIDPMTVKFYQSKAILPASHAMVELCPSGSFEKDDSTWSIGEWIGDSMKSSLQPNGEIVLKAILYRLTVGKKYFISLNWKQRLNTIDSPSSKIAIHLGKSIESPLSTISGVSCKIIDEPGRYEFELIAGVDNAYLNFYAYNVPSGKEGRYIISDVSVIELD